MKVVLLKKVCFYCCFHEVVINYIDGFKFSNICNYNLRLEILFPALVLQFIYGKVVFSYFILNIQLKTLFP